MAETTQKLNFGWQFEYLNHAIQSLSNSTDLKVSLQNQFGEAILCLSGLNGSHPTVKADQFYPNGIEPEPFELDLENGRYRLRVLKNALTSLETKTYHVGIYAPSRLLSPILERVELYFGRITLPPIVCIYEERL